MGGCGLLANGPSPLQSVQLGIHHDLVVGFCWSLVVLHEDHDSCDDKIQEAMDLNKCGIGGQGSFESVVEKPLCGRPRIEMCFNQRNELPLKKGLVAEYLM